MRSALVAFLSVFIISALVSCSSDDDSNQTDSWTSWVGYLFLDSSTKSSIKIKYSDVRINPQRTKCYVEGNYYDVKSYTDWCYKISDGSFLFSHETCYFFESNNRGYMLVPDTELLKEVYICDNEYKAIFQGCHKISLGGSGTSSGNTGSGSSGSTDSDDVAGHTYYTTVRAIVFTEIGSKTTDCSYENVDIYKKGTNYYIRFGTYDFSILTRSRYSTHGGYSVSGYNYFTIKTNITVSYYYYVNL